MADFQMTTWFEESFDQFTDVQQEEVSQTFTDVQQEEVSQTFTAPQ